MTEPDHLTPEQRTVVVAARELIAASGNAKTTSGEIAAATTLGLDVVDRLLESLGKTELDIKPRPNGKTDVWVDSVSGS